MSGQAIAPRPIAAPEPASSLRKSRLVPSLPCSSAVVAAVETAILPSLI